MDECIEYPGARNSDGYGSQRLNGKVEGAHRVAWIKANGPIPAGLHVLHKCDNPPCINIRHLRLGTKRENTRDMCRKNRQARGVRNARAKLTPEKVQEIRRKLAGGEGSRAVAREYHMAHSTIVAIHHNRTWVQ